MPILWHRPCKAHIKRNSTSGWQYSVGYCRRGHGWTPADGDVVGEHSCCCGYCVDLLLHLSTALNFTFDLLLSPQAGASIQENITYRETQWTAIVGDLVTRRADIAVAPITITPERVRVIDFSKPFKYQGITITIKRTETVSKLNSFLQPIQYKLWLLVGVALHFVALALYLLDRFSPFGRYRLAGHYRQHLQQQEQPILAPQQQLILQQTSINCATGSLFPNTQQKTARVSSMARRYTAYVCNHIDVPPLTHDVGSACSLVYCTVKLQYNFRPVRPLTLIEFRAGNFVETNAVYSIVRALQDATFSDENKTAGEDPFSWPPAERNSGPENTNVMDSSAVKVNVASVNSLQQLKAFFSPCRLAVINQIRSLPAPLIFHASHGRSSHRLSLRECAVINSKIVGKKRTPRSFATISASESSTLSVGSTMCSVCNHRWEHGKKYRQPKTNAFTRHSVGHSPNCRQENSSAYCWQRVQHYNCLLSQALREDQLIFLGICGKIRWNIKQDETF